MNGLEIGDVVVRTDVKSRAKYVVMYFASDNSGWVYTRKIGDPRARIVTFSSAFMLKPVKD